MKLLLISLVFTALCYAADIAGKWNLTAPRPNGAEMKAKLVIQDNGGSYSGLISSEQGDAALKNVQVKDSELTFLVETDEVVYEVKAIIDGDSMKGNFLVNKNPGGSFSGIRAKNN